MCRENKKVFVAYKFNVEENECDSESNNLKENIIRLKNELNRKIEENKGELNNQEIMELSQKLDKVILEYIKEDS